MNPQNIPVAVIKLGRIVSTPNAVSKVSREVILKAIQRHQAGDWGVVSDESRIANDKAIIEGSRILSVYKAPDGTAFWVITEADRSSTAILLPEEY
jgi:hypothetical protein